jgi:hypothetical protein
MIDLNTAIASQPQWTLKAAYDINDSAWIVAQGMGADGNAHAVLLTPVPEPSTLALVGIGAAGLLAYVRRRVREQ